MSDYDIVKLMNESNTQGNGDSVVALPGGKRAMNIQSTDTDNLHTTPPTGVSVADANSNWGSGHIAFYPQFYNGKG